MTDKVQKIREEVKKRYEYWKEKESNSHSIESEIRMSECQHLLLMLNSLQEEPISERFAFKAIPRLLEMIEPTDRAKAYIAKLSDALEVEGYSIDAKIVRESLKIMNGEKVPMATMDEEPVSKDLEEAEKDLALTWEDISKIISIDQQVCGTIGISDYTYNHQQAMKEVLKRFKEMKK